MRRVIAIAVTMGVAVASCASSAKVGDLVPAAAGSAYRLGPNDQVRVSVFGLDPIANTYLVDDTGAIALPMLSSIAAGGKTLREVETAIAARVRERDLVRDPQVSVQIVGYRPFYISGEVQRPGPYPYVPGMSLMTAVSIAGGYTFRAQRKTATVSRAASQGEAKPDTPIMPGDVILVKERWF